MVSDFGISTAVAKYTAEYSALNSPKLKTIFFNSLLLVLFLTSVLIVLITLFGDIFFGENSKYLFSLFPLIVLGPLTSLIDGIYRGLKKFRDLAVISSIAGFLALVPVYFLVLHYGLVGAFWGQNLFYIILFLVSTAFYRDFSVLFDRDVIKEVSRYSLIFGFAVLGYFLFSRIDVVILGHYGFISEIASYELLNKIFAILLIPFAILGQVIAPDFTALYVKGEFQVLKRLYIRYLTVLFFVSTLVSLFLYFVIPLLVQKMLPDYFDSTLFVLLLPCVIIYALQFLSAPLNAGIVVPTGHANLMVYMNVFMGVGNVLLALFLLFSLGFAGVIYATLISNFIGLLILQHRFYSKISALS
jgi:O-antigen/teichoic acid export membrane protein